MPAPRRSRKPAAASNAAVLAPDGRHATCDGVNFQLARPDTTEREWIGQGEILRQLLACWLVVDPTRPAAVAAAHRAARHRQDDAGDGRRPPPQAAALHQPVHRRHPARRPARHARARRVGQDRLPRLAAGLGHAHRRRLRPRRGQPHEREVVGQPGPAARPPPLRRERRGRHHHPRPRRLPRLRHDERGRVDLRGARLHPLAAPADADARLPGARRRDGDPRIPPALRRGRSCWR